MLDRVLASPPRPAPLFLAGAVLVATASVVLDWRLLVPLALGLPLTVGALLTTDPDVPEPRPGGRPGRAPRPLRPPGPGSLLHRPATLGAIWAALLYLTTLQLLAGRRSVSAAAEGAVSADILLELLAVGAAGAVVASALRRGTMGLGPPVARLLILHATLAFLSASWSRLSLYSYVRATELVVIVLFTAYCASRASEDPAFLDDMLEQFLRAIAIVAVVLAFYGLSTGGMSADRFTWKGTHPNNAASILIVPLLAIAFHPQRARITRPVPWWLVCAGLLPLVHATGSRGTIAAAVAATVAMALIRSLHDSRAGALAVAAALIVGGLVSLMLYEEVVEFVMRGQSTDSVAGLNGRIEVWRHVLAEPLGSEVWGVGYGAARGVLPVSWGATNVHSAWIDTLQTLGVLGLGTLGATVLTTISLAVLRRSVVGIWLVTFVFVSSLTSITIAQPGYMFILLCVSIVTVSATRPAAAPTEPDASVPRDAVPVGAA